MVHHTCRSPLVEVLGSFASNALHEKSCEKYQVIRYVTIVEFWGLPPLIPLLLLQCVNRLGFEVCSVNNCQTEQGS